MRFSFTRTGPTRACVGARSVSVVKKTRQTLLFFWLSLFGTLRILNVLLNSVLMVIFIYPQAERILFLDVARDAVGGGGKPPRLHPDTPEDSTKNATRYNGIQLRETGEKEKFPCILRCSQMFSQGKKRTTNTIKDPVGPYRVGR